MTTLMTLADAAAMVPGSALVGDGARAFERVHTDTRTLRAGDLFVALKGERFDAHDFLPQARAAARSRRSARTASRRPASTASSSATRSSAAALAAGWRRRFVRPVIAVTGSNGKTTVTQMIASILRAAYGDAAHATAGNLNNHIGVPLTVLQLRATHRAAVVELGMNHPGEIAVLARIAQPTVALVNNAQREHQEFMGTVEAVARENGAAIEALPARRRRRVPVRRRVRRRLAGAGRQAPLPALRARRGTRRRLAALGDLGPRALGRHRLARRDDDARRARRG
jgi:UDP-N-acetylmuramoyl-tripeptide--D-alanyl-D-alanine ligase